MAMTKTTKSILKKPRTAFSPPSREERDRELAHYHATLIRQRKDVEMEILSSIERLIDFPVYQHTSAANPAPEDVALLKKLIRPFQPSDYDSLIQERNINGNCGYSLCPRPRIKDNSSGRFRLLGMTGRAKDFKVVPKEELEKWCSEDCARRALYVKVQLNESPGWERMDSAIDIELLDEQKTEMEKREAQLAEDLRKLDLGRLEISAQAAVDLALERGDKGATAMMGRVGVEITEKSVTRAAMAPSFDAEDLNGELHLTLEGHTPNFGSSQMRQNQENIDDEHGDYENDTGMNWS